MSKSGCFDLKFSENLKLLIFLDLDSHNKDNMQKLPKTMLELPLARSLLP